MESHKVPDQLQRARQPAKPPLRDDNRAVDRDGERHREEMRDFLLARIREKTQRQARG
jgi:hypothetical protein